MLTQVGWTEVVVEYVAVRVAIERRTSLRRYCGDGIAVASKGLSREMPSREENHLGRLQPLSRIPCGRVPRLFTADQLYLQRLGRERAFYRKRWRRRMVAAGAPLA